jgi:hypothetical protein
VFEDLSDQLTPDGIAVNRYFELSTKIDEARRDGDFHAAIAAVRESLPLLPTLVRNTKREFGRFDINRSIAVETGSTLLAVMGDRAGIHELRATLQSLPELKEWLSAAAKAEEDADLVAAIMMSITEEPGLLQSALKSRTHHDDGRRLSTLASWLEKAKLICRIRQGSSYALYLPGSVPLTQTASPDKTIGQRLPSISAVPQTRQARKARAPAEVNLKTLPYVRLPKAPPMWQERQAESRPEEKAPSDALTAEPKATAGVHRFTTEGMGWTIAGEEKLSPADRPDPIYREVFHAAGHTYWLDPKGRRLGFEEAPAVLRVTDRDGRFTAERGLSYDVYRSDVNTDGSGILFLSRDGVLHGYDHQLATVILERVVDCPEYAACATRLGIPPRELKNHVRCVAISPDRSRYLVTVVDEAWCFWANGDPLWGLRLPTQEGWTRVVAPRTERVGTGTEVQAAMRMMELALPVTPEEIAQQYRQLAMRWHPDLNPGDPEAGERMKRLNNAMELLTGADLSLLSSRDREGVTYQRILQQTSVTGTGLELTVSLVMSEKSAADWIYAANFAAQGSRVYLAGYSGRAVSVSEQGEPQRAYDIGAVPRQIVDTGSHLYLLADTRLYVLAGDRLEALVDVYDRGDLVVADTGFALLEPKSLTWFAPGGRVLGAVRTKDPIRRVLSTKSGLIVETRQHRAIISGAPSWWRE